MNILTIGYITKGNTDKRFLANIIRKTFESLAFDCIGQIEVYDPQHINVKEKTFVETVVKAAKENIWANILCVHADSDHYSDDNAFNNKINPSISAVELINGDACKNIVPVVPIQMTEAWMLADRNLLKDVIYTDKSLQDLGLPNRYNQIEQLNDPKQTIENAIRIAFEGFPNRRRRISIDELYIPVSQRINISELDNLSSYKKFKISAAQALRTLNYML